MDLSRLRTRSAHVHVAADQRVSVEEEEVFQYCRRQSRSSVVAGADGIAAAREIADLYIARPHLHT